MNCQDHLYRNQTRASRPPLVPRAVRRRAGRDGARPAAGELARGYRRDRSARAEAAALRAQGQERHLPVHGRRAEPPGAVRQQAAAGEVRRHAAARRAAEGLPGRVHQSRTRSCSGPKFKFAKHGKSGAELSELLPHLAKVVDDIAIVKSMDTDAFNHAPGQILMNTGSQQFGRPSMGAWVTYGLGSESQDLPGFVVFSSGKKGPSGGNSNWGSGFLPTVYQGVQFRGSGDPVLYLSNPAGRRRRAAARFARRDPQLNQMRLGRRRRSGDRHAHQLVRDGVPDADQRAGADGLSQGAEARLDMYGAEPGKPSFANNCLLARRLVERGVRFVQLFHEAWDQHGNLVKDLKKNCKDTDQACAALVKDLKQRGMLDDTLVIWGGEFGRTPMVQGGNDGRDHHPNAFTMWLAGGGIKPGIDARRERRARLQRREGQGPRPRPARHDPAPAGLRPHEADLPLPGPRLPADRRARQCGARSCWRSCSGVAGQAVSPAGPRL